MGYKNIPQIQFASDLLIDKIIGTTSGSFSLLAPAAGGTTTVTVPFPTNFNDTTLFQGIFSLDNGVNWLPFQTDIKQVESSDPSVNPQGDVRVYGESNANVFNIIGTNQRNSSSTFGTNYTVLYKLALIAKKTQGIITPLPIGSKILFDSRLNYQKIAVDDVTPVNGTGVVVTVPHNLGYSPRIRCYRESGGVLRSAGWSLSKKVTLDNTNAYVTVAGAFNGNIHTRIYYDA